jgi:hypothetical protein
MIARRNKRAMRSYVGPRMPGVSVSPESPAGMLLDATAELCADIETVALKWRAQRLLRVRTRR